MVWLLIAVAAAVFGAAAALLFLTVWLWKTPLTVHGRASGGFTRPVDAGGYISFRPFTVVPERSADGKLCAVIRFRKRVIRTIVLEGGPKKDEPETKSLEDRISGGSRAVRFISRYWGFRNIAAHLLSCRRFTEVERFAGYLEYGFEDPSVTGRIYGHQCEFRALTDRWDSFHLTPVWQPGDHLDFEVNAALSFYPVRFAGSLIWFAVSRFDWRLFIADRRDLRGRRLTESEHRAA